MPRYALLTRLSPLAVVLLAFFLLIDLAFFGFHLLYSAGYLTDARHLVDAERGYAEIFQYVQFMLGGLAMTWLFLRTRVPIRLVIGLLFFYLLLDDSFAIHERTDDWLRAYVPMFELSWLPTDDVWQAVTGIALGVFFLGAIGLTYRRVTDALLRQRVIGIVLCLIALGGFAVFVDAFHAAVRFPGWYDALVSLLEDGGEMIAVTGALFLIFDDLIQHYYPASGDGSSTGLTVAPDEIRMGR